MPSRPPLYSKAASARAWWPPVFVRLEECRLIGLCGLSGLLAIEGDDISPRIAASVNLDCSKAWHSEFTICRYSALVLNAWLRSASRSRSWPWWREIRNVPGRIGCRFAIAVVVVDKFLDNQAASWIDANRYVVRDDARRFETWDSNVAGRIGLGVAVDYALVQGIDAIASRVIGLAALMRAALARITGITVHDQGAEQCGIVTFSSVRGLSCTDSA